VARTEELRHLVAFCKTHGLPSTHVTTKTVAKDLSIDGVTVRFMPASLYCYMVGFDLVNGVRRS
jgi:hypothetical protein